jgi:hypothetical protein
MVEEVLRFFFRVTAQGRVCRIPEVDQQGLFAG